MTNNMGVSKQVLDLDSSLPYGRQKGLAKLDSDLFEKLMEYGGAFEPYEYLGGKAAYRREQRDKFFEYISSGKKLKEGDSGNPVLDYPDLDEDGLLKLKNGLLELREELDKSDSQDISAEEADNSAETKYRSRVVSEVYRWRIKQKLLEIDMLLILLSNLKKREAGDEAGVDWEKFNELNDLAHGAPEKSHFANVVLSVFKVVAEAKLSDDPILKEAALELERAFPVLLDADILDNYREIELGFKPLSKDKEKAFQEMLGVELRRLLGGEAVSDELNAEQISEVFRIALNEVGAAHWGVEIDENKTNISMSQAKEMAIVPGGKALAADRVKSLTLHEIGSHVARRIYGQNGILSILGVGFDDGMASEEGVATGKEQLLKGEVTALSGFDAYLAIGLTRGLDGKKRDFTEVFEIISKYYYLENLRAGMSETEAKEKSNLKAWNRCVRTFRGTFCDVPGVCFTKDLAYRRGNAEFWAYLMDNDIKSLDDLVLGRYDYTNPRHVWALRFLGILEHQPGPIPDFYVNEGVGYCFTPGEEK